MDGLCGRHVLARNAAKLVFTTKAPRGSQLLRLPAFRRRRQQQQQQQQPCKPSAFLLMDMLLAPQAVPVQPPSEVVMAVTIAPLASAPQCLFTIDMDQLASAPSLSDHGHGVQRVLAARQDSVKLDAAVCLASPVVLEETVAEVVWESAEEEAMGQKLNLARRFASEVQLKRQSSLEAHIKGEKPDKRWTNFGSGLPPKEVQQLVMQELLEKPQDKNKLVLGETSQLVKPDESISLEEPDSELLTSCLASVDHSVDHSVSSLDLWEL